MRGPQNKAITREALQRLYVDDPSATMASVGKHFGVHHEAIRRALKFYGLPIRPRRSVGVAIKPHTKILANKEWLEGQMATKNMTQIARELGCSDGSVFMWAKKHGLAVTNQKKSVSIKAALAKRYPNGRPADEHPNWKGGKGVYGDGYVWLHAPQHPLARGGRVAEHRMVMEQHLGRYLEPDEIVHHIDGDKQNNAIENLQLTHQAEHVSNHWKASHEVKAWRTFAHELLHRVEELERKVAELEERIK